MKTIQSIDKNYNEIRDAFNKIKNGSGNTFDADDIALASGLVCAIEEEKFLFMLKFLCQLLDLIEPANKILQSREVGFSQAKPIVEAVHESILTLRTDDSFKRFFQLVKKLMNDSRINELTETKKNSST